MYQQQQPIDPHDGCIHDSHAEGTFSVSLSVLAMCSFIMAIIWNNILWFFMDSPQWQLEYWHLSGLGWGVICSWSLHLKKYAEQLEGLHRRTERMF